MRRLALGTIILMMLAPMGARAETVWSCEQDGRLGGRGSAHCVTMLDPGSYRVEMAGLTRESSGELRVSLAGTMIRRCTVLANAWSCDDETRGLGPAGAWPSLELDVAESTELLFRTFPPECGTLTCDREPQIIAGRFRIRVESLA